MNQYVSKDSQKVAGRVYDPSDYQKNDELSTGLARTHEQFSDSFMEGEIGAAIDFEKGTDIGSTRKK